MQNEIAIRESVKAEIAGFEMKPRSLDEAMKFAQIMAESDLVPSSYRGKPGNVLVAIQLGSELGLSPMRSLRSIAVINGRGTLWGDDLLAMVLASPVCEYVDESDSTDKIGVCKTKRKGCAEQVSTFTLEDAKRAGLLGKSGPWQTNTNRMLKLRARGFALRDTFADVLAGLVSAEEALDLPPTETATPEATMLEANQPLTLKEKLKAKVELIDEGAAGVAPVSEGDTLVAGEPVQPHSPAPSTSVNTGWNEALAGPYLDRIGLSQSVRECSETINQALADKALSVFDHTTIQEAGKKKIVELRKK